MRTVFFLFGPLSVLAARPASSEERPASADWDDEGDDEATITAAFRTRAAQWHPDRNEGNRDEATRRFEEINRAFRALNQNGNTAGEAMDLSEMLLFFQFMMGGASQPTEDAAALSVSELKKRLEERGVDYAGCVEKSDLVELLERETAEDQRRVAKARRAARKKAQQRRKKAREKAERNSSEEQDAAHLYGTQCGMLPRARGQPYV